MTEAQAKDKLISVAIAEVGYREDGDNWNKYAAELDPLGITWGNKQNLPWCGEFVLWCAYKAFGRKKGLELMCSGDPSGIPLCSAGAQYFKDAGRWHTTDPQKGDVIYFYYDGGINHTGIITSVSGGLIYTIEGNSSDMVSRRTYASGSAVIAGYGRPKWSVVADVDDAPIEDDSGSDEEVVTTAVNLPVLAKGDKCESVKALKALLVMHGYRGGFTYKNPNFGTNTKKAVLKFQADHGLEQDGVVGKHTWSALLGVK